MVPGTELYHNRDRLVNKNMAARMMLLLIAMMVKIYSRIHQKWHGFLALARLHMEGSVLNSKLENVHAQ